jgi:hypothetical protein
LTGFVFCPECGAALTCQKTKKTRYYRHRKSSNCSYCGIGVDLLESQVLDYLYSFFLDEPTYNKAIKTALPSNGDRLALENDIEQVNSRLAKVNSYISNLINAVIAGGDVSLFRDKQDELKAQKKALETRINELNQTLATMPNIEHIKQNSMFLRIQLMEELKGKDWRKLDYNDVRCFLHFLFSDNPRKTGYGIFVSQKNNRWKITFKGCVQFNHDVIDGRPVDHILQMEGERLSKAIKKGYNDEVKKIGLEYRTLKPKMGNKLHTLQFLSGRFRDSAFIEIKNPRHLCNLRLKTRSLIASLARDDNSVFICGKENEPSYSLASLGGYQQLPLPARK